MNERTRLGGVLIHYGVKGMKWGVRRSPEELGHAPKQHAESEVENTENDVTIEDGFYVDAKKGLTADTRKVTEYLLKPDSDHYLEFINVGYSEDNPDQLMNDILKAYDADKKIGYVSGPGGKDKYSVVETLGIDEKRPFRTVWEVSPDGGLDKFVTAYRDRRVEDEDE